MNLNIAGEPDHCATGNRRGGLSGQEPEGSLVRQKGSSPTWVSIPNYTNTMGKEEKDPETPAQVLGEKEPFARDLINKTSAKWTKRTQGAIIKWPEGGTFDMGTCERMRALILNHKQKDHSKKRQKKRSSELMVLSKFYVNGRNKMADNERMWKGGVVETPEEILKRASAP